MGEVEDERWWHSGHLRTQPRGESQGYSIGVVAASLSHADNDRKADHLLRPAQPMNPPRACPSSARRHRRVTRAGVASWHRVQRFTAR